MGNLASALDLVLDDGDLSEATFRLFTVLPRGTAEQVPWRTCWKRTTPN